jgi:hypothetical protein
VKVGSPADFLLEVRVELIQTPRKFFPGRFFLMRAA